MGKKITRRAATLASLASVYADQGAEAGDELVIPDAEGIAALSAEELDSLRTRAGEAFDTLYGDDGTGLSDEQYAHLDTLGAGLRALDAEYATRQEAAAERTAAAQALAAEVRGTQTAAAEGDDEETPAEGDEETPAEGEGDGEETPADTEPESVTAAGAPAPRGEARIPLSAVNGRRRTAAPQRAASDEPTIADYMVASGEGLDVAVGAPLDFAAAGEALNKRLKTFNKGQFETASKRGLQIRQQNALLQINRPIPEELQVRSDNPADIRDVFERAADESRLPGGSLVASGSGWCAPSQVLYDLYDSGESRDGLLSIPEVGVPRGGLSFSAGPDFADLFSAINAGQIGFSFTEQDDIDGFYARGTAGSFQATTAMTVGQVIAVSGAFLHVVTAGTTGGSAPTPPAIGGTVTSGTVTFERRETSNVAGDKPCYKVTCPPFEEYRLDVDGLCISAGILQSRGFPEVLADTIRKVLIGHDHYMNGKLIQQIANGSTAVTLPATQAGTAAPVLTAIELQVESYRYARRLSRTATLEAVFPYWIRGAIRSDLSRRLGVDLLSVPDSRIDAWFRERGIAPQFVYNWQPIAASGVNAWPTTVSFLLYRAGTWIKGGADVITVDTLYDSVLLGQNDFTALFTEEGWFVAKRGNDSRLVTTSLSADGATHIGVEIAHNGTAA